MKRVRFIPRLDIKGPNLVKGIQLEGLRALGLPGQYARSYYEEGADELLFVDVVASLYDRNNLHQIIEETAKSIFIPITVGGGIRSLDDIGRLLNSGADKVAINTAAFANPKLIEQAANRFGSSTIVIAIEVIRQADGSYECFTDNGRQETGVEAISWAKKAAALGAGEIIVTSVDREGTGRGFDHELVRRVVDCVDVPVIAHGGASSTNDITRIATELDVSGVAVASVCHYHLLKRFMRVGSGLETASNEGNTAFAKSGSPIGKFETAALADIKKALCEAGLLTRSI